METLGLIGSVVSPIFGLVGSITQGAAQAQAANYQAAVARNNQIIADQNARYAEQAGRVQAQNKDIQTRAVLGQELAAQAASGIDINSPSAQARRAATAQLGRLDTATIMQNTALQVRADQIEASGFQGQAQLDALQARNASTAGFLGAGKSIIGGASSFADKWLSYQLKGVGSAAGTLALGV